MVFCPHSQGADSRILMGWLLPNMRWAPTVRRHSSNFHGHSSEWIKLSFLIQNTTGFSTQKLFCNALFLFLTKLEIVQVTQVHSAWVCMFAKHTIGSTCCRGKHWAQPPLRFLLLRSLPKWTRESHRLLLFFVCLWCVFMQILLLGNTLLRLRTVLQIDCLVLNPDSAICL